MFTAKSRDRCATTSLRSIAVLDSLLRTRSRADRRPPRIYARFTHFLLPLGEKCGLAIAAILLAGCGSIGDPLPPMANIPQVVDDLAALQVADEVIISWSWPLLTTEGATARRVRDFTLVAVDVDLNVIDLPPEVIAEHGRNLSVIDEAQLDGKAPGNRFELRVPLADWKLDQQVILAVTAANRSGRSAGYSNQVRLQPVTPPAAVTIAAPIVKADGAELSWSAVSTADVYAVERRFLGEDEFTRIARVDQPVFLDRMIEWDRPHEYRVRSIATTVADEAEGKLSEVVTVTPTDTFPPTAPSGLRAVSTTSSVELSWDSNRDPDLARYQVFRNSLRIADGIERASFSDTTASPGQEYSYSVTAIDMAGNGSGRSESVMATRASR